MVADAGGAPPRLVSPLEALLGLWRRRYAGRPIPGRARFEAFELEPWARHIAWIEVAQDEQFRIRNFGIELIRRFGREASNDRVDDLAPDIATGLREKLIRAVATAAPAVGGASVQLGREAAVFSELVLPMAQDAGRVNLLLFASYELRADGER